MDLLQKHVSLGIGDDDLSHPVPSSLAGVDDSVSRHALFYRRDSSVRVTFLFREILVAVGNKKLHVTSIRLIYSRIVDLVQDSVRNCEPDLALVTGGCSHPFFGARRPPRRDTGPARSSIFCR